MPGRRSWWPRPSALRSSLSSSRSSASRSRGTLRPASPTRRNALRSRVREVAMRSAGHRSLSFAIVAIMLAVSCSGTGTGGGGGGQLTKVRLQLQWVAQSQFAGYYAALDKGYFKDLGLDVEIKLGGPYIVPQQVVASDAAEFGIAWVPKGLASREAGADLVNIAQVFQRSGTLEVSFKEYAQVLEQKNPKTGQLYTPAELNVIDFNQVGTGMLQDHIFVRQSWLSKSGNEDIAAKFLQASFKGWIYCRDNQTQCVDTVLKAGTTLGKGHMTWQLNEINALIWPSPNGIGALDKAAWDQTVNISTTYQVLKNKPADAAFRTDLAKKAADALKAAGADVNGASFKQATGQVTAGGN